MITSSELGALDYVVLIGLLVFALAIGMYYAFKDKKSSIMNYYFGSKRMHPIPTGLSISLTFASAYTVIGISTQVYIFGTIMTWFVVAQVMSQLVAHCYYIPLVRRMKLTSVYEYLEMRFHPSVRTIASVLSIINMVIFMSINIYIPSMALNAVTNVNLDVALVITAIICTVYTAIGGIKAVVWTDTLQALVIVTSQIVISVMGVNEVGGWDEMVEALVRGGRNTMMNFNADITYSYTFWTTCVGLAVALSGASCADQSTLTRYLSCKTTRDARIANFTALVPSVVIIGTSVLLGCVLYAYFELCFPLFTGEVAKADQLLPLMAVRVLGKVPGLTGLFMSGLYAGALSTVSSGLNALSMLTMEDFLQSRFPICCKSILSGGKKLLVCKIFVFIYGAIVMGCAFLFSRIGGTFLEKFITISGTVAGPILGLFTLGAFVPWANYKGALTGQVVATALGLWMSIGSFLYQKVPQKQGLLPVGFNCTGNMTFGPMPVYHNEGLPNTLYAVSPFSYVLVAVTVVVVVGTIVSFITKAEDPSKMDAKMFVPLFDLPFLPSSVNKFFRFGVSPIEEDHVQENSPYSNEKRSEIASVYENNHASTESYSDKSSDLDSVKIEETKA